MGLFGKRKQKNGTTVSRPAADSINPAEDPNMIRVFDKYGQELFITREAWRGDVLTENIRDDITGSDHCPMERMFNESPSATRRGHRPHLQKKLPIVLQEADFDKLSRTRPHLQEETTHTHAGPCQPDNILKKRRYCTLDTWAHRSMII